MPTKNVKKNVEEVVTNNEEMELVNEEIIEEVDAAEEIVEKTSDKNAKKAKVVNCYSVNLRKGASFDDRIITTLDAKEIVDVISFEGEWTKVKTSKGVTGFINSSFLKMI